MTKALSEDRVPFARRQSLGVALCWVAWMWTAYECDTIGIEVFDRFLKIFPYEPYALAAVLAVLTCKWMSNLLTIRALSAIFMLFPAELLPAIRLCDTQWRLVLVVFSYVCAIIGMFGMFYPWRIRQALTWCSERPVAARVLSLVLVATAVLVIVAAFMTFSC